MALVNTSLPEFAASINASLGEYLDPRADYATRLAILDEWARFGIHSETGAIIRANQASDLELDIVVTAERHNSGKFPTGIERAKLANLITRKLEVLTPVA